MRVGIPGEQRNPVALSTADGAHAMGIISPDPAPAGSVEWSSPTLRIEATPRGAVALLEPGQHTLTARVSASGETLTATVSVRKL